MSRLTPHSLRFLLLPFFALGLLPQIIAAPARLVTEADLRPVGERGALTINPLNESLPPGESVGRRIEVGAGVRRPQEAALRAIVSVPPSEGEIARFRLWARAVRSPDESGQVHFRFVASEDGKGWPRLALAQMSADREWREYSLPFRLETGRTVRQIHFSIEFGYGAQTLEIAGPEVLNHGSDVAMTDLPRTRARYPGDEPDAPWRAAALERIERVRVGQLALELVGPDGRPLAGAELSARMLRSAFDFGTCLRAARLVGTGEDDEIYRRKLLDLFNAGGLENELKWPPWVEHRYPRETTLAGLRWMKDNGLASRGHVLVWPSWRMMPKAVAKLRGTPREHEVREAALAHVRDILGATQGLVSEWDVINEPFNHHDLMDIFGRGILVDIWKEAERHAPGVGLYINDWGNHDERTDPQHVQHFEDTARFLIESGARVDGLGLQAHFGGLPNAPEAVLATLDRYQRSLGLPVRFTEFDINTDDEEMQAAYTRDFLILAYSHPSVVGVQTWGFWEGQIYSPVKALYRADWSEKPNGAAWRELVAERWRTRGEGRGDARGRWNLRAHHGRYEIEARTGDRTFRFEVHHTAANAGRAHRLVVTDQSAESPAPVPSAPAPQSR